MEFIPGEVSGNAEDVTGRKKSKLQVLKGRLFGRLKKKETEGRMKQSQSTGDVTAPESGRSEDDSEDEYIYPEGLLSSRALSHESIFLAEQNQSSQPTRVLSQENVHSKIKELQMKLQQQNMRLSSPMLIFGKRTEDSGATSEDDGLPCSPPDISYQEYPKARSYLSSLSLAGTGSEEEEPGGFSLSRPLPPVAKISPAETPSVGVDFSSPAQYIAILDNSAARHRMSIKPRNQRVSTRGKRPGHLNYPRSSSMNSLDQPLSEKEETDESFPPSQITPHCYEDSAQTAEPVSLPSTARLKQDQTSNGNNITTELFQYDRRTNTASHVSSDDITASYASNHTRESITKGALNANQYTNRLNVNDEHQTNCSLVPLSICPVDITRDYSVKKERRDDDFKANLMGSLKTTTDVDVTKYVETILRSHPVPIPRIKMPDLSNINNTHSKISSAKPVEAEKKTVPPSGLTEPFKEDDKEQRSSSFRFNIASARYRSKTGEENVAKQNEESFTRKGQLYTQNPVIQIEKAENIKSTEDCKGTFSAADKRSCLSKEEKAQNVSKVGLADSLEKSERCSQNTENLKSEADEQSRDLFGIKLRSTSLCLKYRSEVPKSPTDFKSHSLESKHVLPAKEAVPDDMEVLSNDKKANVLQNPAPQRLDSQQDTTLDKGNETDCKPEPAWRSHTREKNRVQQSSSIKLSTPQTTPPNSIPLSIPQSLSTQQCPKPSLQHRLQLPSTIKPQPVSQSQQIPPKAAPRAMDRWAMSNQREEKSSVSQSKHRDELLDFKGQAKLAASSHIQTDPAPQSPSDNTQPPWMELAKRKSLAWSDKTFESMNI